MKGSSTSRNPKLQNYQLSSLGSNSSVQSIIASMNGGGRGEMASRSVAKYSKDSQVAAAVSSRFLEKSQSNPKDSSKSIASDTDRKSVDSTEEKRESGDNAKCVADSEVHKGDGQTVKESDSSRTNGSGNKNVLKMKTKSKGHGQCPSSGSDNEIDNEEDDEDDSDLSSAEESSEELDSSSSSSSSGSEKENRGGLEPISEEQSLRIDLPDHSSTGNGATTVPATSGSNGSKRSRPQKSKIIDVEDEEVDDDDGNCRALIDFPNHNETALWPQACRRVICIRGGVSRRSAG